MKTLFTTLVLVAALGYNNAQAQLSRLIGVYTVDMSQMDHLSQTRAGSERLANLKRDNLLLEIYKDEDSGQLMAAMFSDSFSKEESMWIGECVPGKLAAEFNIVLDEIYDGKQRTYRCAYAIENGFTTIRIDPYFAHMTAQPNSGQGLEFIPSSEH